MATWRSIHDALDPKKKKILSHPKRHLCPKRKLYPKKKAFKGPEKGPRRPLRLLVVSGIVLMRLPS